MVTHIILTDQIALRIDGPPRHPRKMENAQASPPPLECPVDVATKHNRFPCLAKVSPWLSILCILDQTQKNGFVNLHKAEKYAITDTSGTLSGGTKEMLKIARIHP